MPLQNLTKLFLSVYMLKKKRWEEGKREKEIMKGERMKGRKEGRRRKTVRRKGSEIITWWTTHMSSKYLLKNYSKNKKKLLGEITIPLQPQSNSICLQTICLLIIQLLSWNMPHHVKCEIHKMSSQFIFRMSPWQAVERIIGLSGLATYKARQKCKSLSFKC